MVVSKETRSTEVPTLLKAVEVPLNLSGRNVSCFEARQVGCLKVYCKCCSKWLGGFAWRAISVISMHMEIAHTILRGSERSKIRLA